MKNILLYYKDNLFTIKRRKKILQYRLKELLKNDLDLLNEENKYIRVKSKLKSNNIELIKNSVLVLILELLITINISSINIILLLIYLLPLLLLTKNNISKRKIILKENNLNKYSLIKWKNDILNNKSINKKKIKFINKEINSINQSVIIYENYINQLSKKNTIKCCNNDYEINDNYVLKLKK